MPHCPYCGTKIKEDELYCINCGNQLPNDIYDRLEVKKPFNKLWYVPIILTIFLIFSSGIYYLFLQNQTAEAKELYEKGEKSALKGDYKEAKQLFQDALDHKENLSEAAVSSNFMESVLKLQSKLKDANDQLENQEFQKALTLINESENLLKNFNGTVVTELINTIVTQRQATKIEQLKYELQKKPSIDDLKILLWEADAIKNDEAKEITASIRNQIIDYTFSKASDLLNKKQFSDASILVEDGLKYASDSDKLQSLKTTIDKEKIAFETALEQRIEQAINTAAEEQQLNENDAIELVSVKVESDEQGNLVVKGQVKSVATIPINSILIEYSLTTKEGKEFLSNEVYVYPDTLYPDETGKFEFTHFDIHEKEKNVDIKVNKIKWYTE
ncbi:zinc-ribbon domain-containing protein [Virgibacillus ndiopensis]|uniref:zinc-ribbon domain-containing protein n=1 Tax=Virgibacillus ndiopensis TaxID=2004408 RepID=UPI000C06B50E|nr:zinc ribbon domain-containing protein [Virgibacillus ndiopensis]